MKLTTDLNICKLDNTFQVIENGDAGSRSGMKACKAFSDPKMRDIESDENGIAHGERGILSLWAIKRSSISAVTWL